ncbi:MAG: hypothetical protein ACREIC_30855, partial [Limisphaerales bacterium]
MNDQKSSKRACFNWPPGLALSLISRLRGSPREKFGGNKCPLRGFAMLAQSANPASPILFPSRGIRTCPERLSQRNHNKQCTADGQNVLNECGGVVTSKD